MYNNSIKYTEDATIIKIAIPGVAKDAINISYQLPYLTIKTEDNTYYAYVKSSYNVDGATASLDLGLLTITIPVKESAKPKTITIS